MKKKCNRCGDTIHETNLKGNFCVNFCVNCGYLEINNRKIKWIVKEDLLIINDKKEHVK